MLPAQFFRRLWAPTITRDSWGQWPDSEFGSRTPNTKLMVRRRPIFFRHIGGNYSTSSVHHARSLPSCSLRSIVLPENPCARSRFFEKMCRIFCFNFYFFPRKKLRRNVNLRKWLNVLFFTNCVCIAKRHETAPCWLRHMLPAQNFCIFFRGTEWEKKSSP